MAMLKGRGVVLGVTGSIAAYKSALIVRELVKAGADVRVIMTPGAREFITPLTLGTLSGHPVHGELTDDRDAGTWTDHVELGLWGDVVLVAPATAHTLAGMVEGRGDSLLLTVLLSAKCPVVVAPAMDRDMFTHPATTANLESLRSRGVHVIDPDEGELASGLEGKGRLAEPERIREELTAWFRNQSPLLGRRALITAGPTHEPLDAVRFLGNRSTGRQGIAIAEELARRGMIVDLVAGPLAVDVDHPGIRRIDVETALEMEAAAQQALSAQAPDVIIEQPQWPMSDLQHPLWKSRQGRVARRLPDRTRTSSPASTPPPQPTASRSDSPSPTTMDSTPPCANASERGATWWS